MSFWFGAIKPPSTKAHFLGFLRSRAQVPGQVAGKSKQRSSNFYYLWQRHFSSALGIHHLHIFQGRLQCRLLAWQTELMDHYSFHRTKPNIRAIYIHMHTQMYAASHSPASFLPERLPPTSVINHIIQRWSLRKDQITGLESKLHPARWENYVTVNMKFIYNFKKKVDQSHRWHILMPDFKEKHCIAIILFTLSNDSENLSPETCFSHEGSKAPDMKKKRWNNLDPPQSLSSSVPGHSSSPGFSELHPGLRRCINCALTLSWAVTYLQFRV